MQKRYLVIFSLILISVLLIVGCQQAVGGGNKPLVSPSYAQPYSLTADYETGAGHRYIYNGDCSNKLQDGSCSETITVNLYDNPDWCKYKPGQYVFSYLKDRCYEVKGCQGIDWQSRDALSLGGQQITLTQHIVKVSPVAIPCAQGGGSQFTLDEESSSILQK
ncbi:hypothetical protein HYT57_01655 [Candidatus Woesearchaeota archaeon]|nr:hypothetical protein [Candidatus Woesearchaeota archaeon]